LGVGALMVAVEGVGAAEVDVPLVVGCALAAAALLGAAVVHLLRAPVGSRPLLDLRILAIASYRVTAVGGSVHRLVLTAIPFLL
ncbi:hypothetical protein ABTB41_20070, partial [Acinetobacter baumannii]